MKHPDMKPYGVSRPTIYMLGDAPGTDEDKSGRPFSGKHGRLLRSLIPDRWDSELRWNHVVRTSPPKRDPSSVEMECCRPSVVRDIEASKPVAIFAFGNIPLEWFVGQQGITKWAGRRFPAKVGSHTCWVYPMLDPAYVLSTRKVDAKTGRTFDSDVEFQFTKDLERAFREVDKGLPDPVVHTRDDVMDGVEWVSEYNDGEVDRILSFLRDATEEKVVGLDYECNMPRPYRKEASILTVAVSTDNGTLAFPLDHKEARWTSTQLDRIEDGLHKFFYKAECTKAVHSLSFEQEWTAYFFGKKALRAQPWHCTLSQAYILDERQGALSLEHLSVQYFGINIKKLSPVDRKRMAEEPLDRILPYNGVDAKYHRLLYWEQRERLKRENMLEVYREHLRRVTAAVLTQIRGVPINQKQVAKYHGGYSEILHEIEADIQALPIIKKFKAQTGKAFRPSANDDVEHVVKRMLGKRDIASVDKVALRGVKHEFVDLILEWRENSKLLSTYVEPLLPDAEDVYNGDTLHPILHTTRTRTWRTSSDGPNIQNYPKREHREVRKQISKGGDYRVVSFDYAGIQARNVAMESLDKTLIKYFWERYDIHTDWMQRIIKRVPKWLPKDADKDTVKKYRNIAKNGLVFPSFFGAQAPKIATVCEIKVEVARDLHEEFWEEFPDIKGWHERLKKDYLKRGYVTGLSGFRRHAPVSPNEMINAPIQADESIIVCDAMARLSEMEDNRFQANLMVHDDLTFIWHKSEVERNAEVVIKAMLDCPYEWAHVVPLGVEMSVGMDWAKQDGVGEFYSDQDKIIIQREKII